MFLNYTENSTFYFFSTSAQSVASIVGLSAAVAVFRYQYYLQDISEKRRHILNIMRDSNYLKMFEEKDFLAFNKYTSDKERVEWWRGHLKRAYDGETSAELEKWLKTKIAAQSWAGKNYDVAMPLEKQRLLARFKDNYLEYNALDSMSDRAGKFKARVFSLTIWGLLLVGSGILGTLSPVFPACGIGGQLISKVLFLILLGAYFWKLFALIVQAFEGD
jgi:hypothetical protein